MIYRSLVKRLVDLCLSVILLLALSPVLGVAMILIKIGDPGPIFFTQWRAGRGETHSESTNSEPWPSIPPAETDRLTRPVWGFHQLVGCCDV